MTRRRAPWLLASIPLISGCDILSVGCTDEERPSLRIMVVDSISGAVVPDPLIWIRDGAFVDTLHVFEGSAWGPGEREGRYAVIVEEDGYHPWTTIGIHVGHDGCHVETVELTARLRPERA